MIKFSLFIWGIECSNIGSLVLILMLAAPIDGRVGKLSP